MGPSSRCLLVVAAALAASGSPTRAQEPDSTQPSRHGFWIAVGLGWSRASTTCSTCATPHLSGLARQVALGGSPSPHFLVGAEFNAWLVWGDDHGSRAISAVSGVLMWYPSRTGPWFLKAGLGVVKYLPASSSALEASATSGVLGFGGDVHVSRRVSLTPSLSVFATPPLKNFTLDASSVTPAEPAAMMVVELGLGVSWH